MSLPYMPLYVGDYLKDTRDLTAEQHGAYLLLLMDMWNRNGALPNNPKVLARITGISPKRWPSVWASIGSMFIDDGDFLSHKRVDLELQKADQISQKRKLAGSAGGRAKALKTQEPDVAIAKQVPSKSPSRSEPQPQKKDDDADASSRVKPHFIPADWKPSEALIAWAVHEFRTPNNEQLTEAEIRNEADSFVDYWTGRRDAKAKRPGWDGTFRARIREQAAAIIRARPRSNGAAVRAGARVQTRFAPQVSQHDAFALAAAEAGGSERGAGWEPDHGNGPRPPSGPPRLEVIDNGDARGVDAAYAGGNRGFDSQIVLPLPFAAVR
jgi:uncharacterized protein YdaU (DUF1376 family)